MIRNQNRNEIERIIRNKFNNTLTEDFHELVMETEQGNAPESILDWLKGRYCEEDGEVVNAAVLRRKLQTKAFTPIYDLLVQECLMKNQLKKEAFNEVI